MRTPHLSIVPPSSSPRAAPSAEELAEWMADVAHRADRAAFARLFTHFAPRLKAFLLRGGTDEELAEELVQEAMVAVWRKAVLFDPRQAAVSTWIFTIARNLRVDRFRRQAAAGEPLAEAVDLDAMVHDAPALDEQLHADRMEHRVRTALRQLPLEQAEVLRLSFYEEVPHASIAALLGIPLGTVKSRVRLAVAHLRRLLDAQSGRAP